MNGRQNIMIKKIVLAAAMVLMAMAHAFPQSGQRQVQLGFCSLSSMSSAKSLANCSGGIPALTTYAVICAYAQGVVWRDDGTAPTGTPGSGGMGLSSGQCLPYNGIIANIQFIQQTSGAILGVSFYR
jgi:hypothetical protein